MGAWNVGNFENDYAWDWLSGLYDSDEADTIDNALAVVLDAPASEFIDADDCQAALVATEVVAAALGRPARDWPDEAAAWLAKTRLAASPGLIERCASAVDRIERCSEIKALWEESEYFDQWKKVIADLKARLKG